MGNCLKTQLKEAVQNSNLPTIGKMIVTLKQCSNGYCYFKAGINGLNIQFENATWNSKNSLVLLSGESAGGTNLTSQEGGRMIIDVYDLARIQLPANYITNITGGDSLQYSELTRIIVNPKTTPVSGLSSLKRMVGQELLEATISEWSANDYATFIGNNIETLVVLDYAANTPLLESEILTNSILQVINTYSGNVANLPATIKKFSTRGGSTGSLTALVNKLRTAATPRTSGKITLYNGAETDRITIDDGNGNEVGIKTYCQNNSIPLGTTLYLAWDANSVTLTTDSTGAENADVTINN